MKHKLIFMIITFLMIMSLAGCGAPTASENTGQETTELMIFAAASMTETLTEIGEIYVEENEAVKVSFNFDSSGTLKTQIEEGALCDVFISAGQKQMDQLDIAAGADKNPDGLDCVLQGSRIDLLENKVVLAVPEENPAGIRTFQDLKNALENGSILLSMGNADVPVGQYAQKILTWLGLDEAALASAGAITYGSNVKEIVTHIQESVVDCGIVYATDATAANLTVADTATAEMCGRVVYPAAVMNTSSNKDAALAFLDFLRSEAASAVFRSAGFTPIL